MHTYTPLNTSDSNHDTHPLLDNNTLFSDDDSSDELSEETSMTIRKENDNSSLHKNGNALTNRTLLNAKTSSMKKTDKVDDGFTNRTLLNDETVPVKTDDSNGWTNRTVLGEETSSMKTDDKNNDRLTNRTLLNDKTVSAKTDDSNGRTNRTLLDDETVSAKTDDSNGWTNRTVLRDETSSMKSDDERDDGRKENKKERVKNAEVSLLKVLWKTFGVEAVAIQVWELCLLFLLLSNPLLVGLLIEFIEDSQAPPWRGYLYCALLFLSTVIRSVLDKQVYHLSGCLGLRVRTCVTSAVYRKALRLDVSSRQDSTAGEMVNLMSVDAQHLEEMTTSLYLLWSGPVELVVCLVLLYVILGPSLLAGLAIVFVMIPANILILRELRKCGTKFMELKDSRLKILNEVLNGIKILKMYAWEPSFLNKIEKVREGELRVLFRNAVWDVFLHFSWTVAPYIISLAIFITYIYTDPEHYLRPQTAFVTLAFLNLIRFAINTAPPLLSDMIKASVSIGRLNRFLNQSEVEEDNVCRNCNHMENEAQGHVLSIDNGTFSWNLDLGACLHDVSVHVTRGSLVAVVGPVGAGKSSLLAALLGEMFKMRGRVCVKGSIAYVPQQAWIQHDTVQGNILFGKTMQRSLYDRCLDACALRPDLDILPGADLTEIGEQGINLSGGQKQRVSLARAVYSNTDVYLLDDPLSAVDVHVGRHIFQQVVGHSGLLANKTRLLVTHGVQWLPSCDVIVMMSEGRVTEVGSYKDLLRQNGPFADYLRKCLTQTEPQEAQTDQGVEQIKHQMLQRLNSGSGDDTSVVSESTTATASITINDLATPIQEKFLDTALSSQNGTGRVCLEDAEQEEQERLRKEEIAKNIEEKKHMLVQEEDIEEQEVKWDVYKGFLKAVGWTYSFLIVAIFALYHVAYVTSDIFLSQWTDDTRLNNLTLLPPNSTERLSLNDYYLALYGGFGALQAVTMVTYAILHNYRLVAAARDMHHRMLRSVLHAPMTFFDTTPLGRIVSRFSGDIDTVDLDIRFSSSGTIESTCQMLSSLFVVVYTTPWFLVVVVPLFVVYFLVQRFYILTSRQLKRLASKTRSPVYSYFTETISGVSVIRAYNAQRRFADSFEDRVDNNNRFNFYSYCSNRWLGFRLDVLGGLVVLVTSLSAVSLRHTMSAGLVGLSITYALNVTDNLYFFVMSIGDLEKDLVSLERIANMTNIVQEAPWRMIADQPTSDWPEKGEVKVDDIDIRYREGLDLVLNGVSFSINAGEKVGIVGRTGAGKSTLTLALFRLLELSRGKIRIDDLDIGRIGLHDLRSKLAVLPQDPVVFADSVRSNLDPVCEFSDREVWSALHHAHLRPFFSSMAVGLDYQCGEGGDNLSSGQRQLLCLARTLLHRSCILVLDEATAAVDMATDDLIQQTLRSQFADCTVLTIAHRLHTVMDYDKILVLEKGRVVAFDTPQRLLQHSDNVFYHMAATAGLLHHHHHHHQQQQQQQYELTH
ncbi:multidrug resistance-associated protein 1-like [Littorina saxatilis]